MTLPANLVIEKNKLNAEYPWLILLKFSLYEGQENEVVYYFVRNYHDITFQDHLYQSFSFDLDLIQQSIDGKIHENTLSISNVTIILQETLEKFDGAVDAEITITLVHVDNLTEDFSELELVFDILATHIGPLSIDFILGAPSPLLQRFLTQSYFADFCSYPEFGGPRCGYDLDTPGAPAFCHRRFSDCRALENSARFGGSPCLRKDGIRFV